MSTRNTRYYKVKESTFFSPCGKEDQDETVKDGREYRHWKRAGEEGKTLGYIEKSLKGFVEYMRLHDDKHSGKELMIGLQTSEGVDVLKIPQNNPKWGGLHDHVKTLALSWDTIDLEFPVEFSLFTKKKASGYDAVYLNIHQAGRPVWPNYKRLDGIQRFEGVPDTVVSTSYDGTKEYDNKERDKFLFERLGDLIKRVQERDHKSEREPTPAEAAKAAGNAEEEDDFDF